MAAVLLTPPYLQFFDDNGDPLVGGKIYTYEAGTTTPKATYMDASGTIPATNPIVLDAAGRATIWVNGSYNIRVETSAGVLVKNTDNITAFSTAAAGAGTFTTLSVTDSSTGAIGNHMQCRLIINGSNFQLIPYNGNILSISGVNYIIPQSGVTLSPTGLSATTLYYVYASWNGTAITLGTSGTGYIISGNGVPVRSDNSAQTLVGMVYLKTGASTTGALIRSWANRTGSSTRLGYAANRAVTSTSYVEVSPTERIESLVWQGEAWTINVSGSLFHGTAGQLVYVSVWYDGSVSGGEQGVYCGVANQLYPYATQSSFMPADGYHYANVSGRVAAGTGTFNQSNRVIGMVYS